MWWCIPVIPALGRWRQDDLEFEASPGHIERPYLTQKRKGYYVCRDRHF
jgi:hypothetical protein